MLLSMCIWLFWVPHTSGNVPYLSFMTGLFHLALMSSRFIMNIISNLEETRLVLVEPLIHSVECCICMTLTQRRVYWFEREKERNINVREKHRLVASYTHPNQVQTCNLGMCSDWESEPQPFGVWDDTPTSWPTQLGQILYILTFTSIVFLFPYFKKSLELKMY